MFYYISGKEITEEEAHALTNKKGLVVADDKQKFKGVKKSDRGNKPNPKSKRASN